MTCRFPPTALRPCTGKASHAPVKCVHDRRPLLICDVGAALRIGIAHRSTITKHDTALVCTLARGTAEYAVVVLHQLCWVDFGLALTRLQVWLSG
jgi:hypothetical protein